MTIEAQVSIWIGVFVFFGYILSSGYMNIVGSYGSSMEFFEETPYCFPLAAQAYILTNMGLPFSHTLTNICYLWPFTAVLTGLRWYSIVFLACISDDYIIGHLYAFFGKNIYSNLLPNFWIRFYEVFFSWYRIVWTFIYCGCMGAAYSVAQLWLFATPLIEAHQAPLYMGFSKQEYWSGLPFPALGDLPDSWIEAASPALAGRFFATEPQGKLFALKDRFQKSISMIYIKECSMFYSRSFMVSGLTCRSLIHFEFIFVYGIRKF